MLSDRLKKSAPAIKAVHASPKTGSWANASDKSDAHAERFWTI
jgi:hypothetical protein